MSSQNVCRGARNQRWKPRCQSWADLDVDDAVLLVGHVLSPHPPALRRVALMNFRIEKGYCERNVHYLARQASQYTLQANFKKLKTALFSICFEVRTERAFSEERNACGSSTLKMYVFAHHYEIKIHFSTQDYVLTVEFVRNQIYLPWKLYPAFLFLRTLDVSAKRDLSCFAIDVKYWGE